MTITELLAANPGVELTLAYNETLGVFSVKANRNGFVVLVSWKSNEPYSLENEIKRAMEAVR